MPVTKTTATFGIVLRQLFCCFLLHQFSLTFEGHHLRMNYLFLSPFYIEIQNDLALLR